jgi:DNA invertase Pin-like site-specific DNA recombinase
MVGTGDVLVVWKLDRLGRSLGFLIDLIDYLGKGGAGFKSLSDGIDTTTASGKLVFHIMGALAEFERSLISERTSAGMKAAKRRGRHVGRPPKMTPHKVAHARQLIVEGKETQAGIAALLGVGEATLRRHLNALRLGESVRPLYGPENGPSGGAAALVGVHVKTLRRR